MLKDQNARQKIIQLIRKTFRFAISGGIATLVDYAIYFILFNQGTKPTIAQAIAYSIAVVCNFLLQRAFVFDQKGKTWSTFLFSIGISVGGLLISTLLIHVLNQYSWFYEHQLVTKILATGILFFYNFFLKRYAFERRFL